VVREGQGGEMTQALYAHMNKKIKNKTNLLIRIIQGKAFSFS
jgi:hypothetical protein